MERGGDYEVAETKIWGRNVLAFRLITNDADYYVVVCYIPPKGLETLDQVKAAWDQRPTGFIPLLLVDLNINLDAPWDERDWIIAEQCDAWELTDMAAQFKQRRC